MSQKIILEDGPDIGRLLEQTLLGIMEDETFGDESFPMETYQDLYLDALDPEGETDAPEMTLEDLIGLRHRVDAWARAVRKMKTALDASIAEVVGEGGKFVSGPEFFQVKKKTSFRIKEDRVSDFWAAIEEAFGRASYSTDPEEKESYRNAVRALFNPNQVRKGGLRALNSTGIEFLDQTTGELESVWDLYETTTDEDAPLEVSSMPVDGKSTPKFVSSLPEMEVRYGRGAGTTERPS